ncbi:ABC transporter substrate-binding protein [Janibacter sp. YIM B02568]|uniref:peptide ABC transporter substrate-binding protein n=1 Tax=Janibacter endophyticus TaxID=2806261 RepID=UPI001950318D|nr:ABC transporter substrate-binding protein [Janibacter endophyticus]MBM6545639.1 ABC transporter substrate-binding protein [Janibacter endophyticus]
MRANSRAMAVAGISAVALLATACGGDSDSDSTDAGSAGGAGKTGGEIVMGGCNPENPLVAGNTAETCGGDVLDVLTAKLMKYDPETAEASEDIAESIETEDNQNFTVKIKKGYKFHDGTEVKAKNFVDAWNYTAFGPNAQQGGYFFEPFEGYEEVSGEDSKVKELSGLKVVDDYTFTIKTTGKVSNLPLRLGYTAFAPQPDSFFEDEDKEAFGKSPVAAGPYKFVSWEDNKSIVLEKFADYSGERGGQVDKITFQIFQDQDAEYTALQAGQVDIIRQVPASALVDDTYKTDLPDRNLDEPNSTLQFLGLNYKVDKKLADVKVRQAISMAIDRPTIIKEIFNNAFTPATGWVSPVVDGYKEGACGEYCTYDPEKAKQLLEEGGGYDGKLTLTYNGDGGHKEWTEAVCNSIKNAIEIDCVATPTVDFATMLTALGEREVKGLYRMGWVMDYPSIENYLAPIYGKGASSNYSDFDSPEFQKKMAEANAAATPEEANALYQEAEGIVAEDFTTIPTWYGKTIIGWSEKVDNVKATPFGNPDLTQVTVK